MRVFLQLYGYYMRPQRGFFARRARALEELEQPYPLAYPVLGLLDRPPVFVAHR